MFFHEAGHGAHLRAVGQERYAAIGSSGWWSDAAMGTAREVSTYAMREPSEFVAEVYAGKLSGRKFSAAVEEMYERLGGPAVDLSMKPWGVDPLVLLASATGSIPRGGAGGSPKGARAHRP